MDEKRERFLARLRATFRVEAAEHIDAMASGMIALEQGNDADKALIVERVFREAHSLKGAARSVSVESAELLCKELESIFAGMKREELSPSARTLDSVLNALGVLRIVCDDPGASTSAEITEREQKALTALRAVVSSAARAPARASGSHMETEAVTVRPEPFAAQERSAPATLEPPPGPAAPASLSPEPKVASETVRVSAEKLDTILLEAEELVGSKISAREHVADLQAVVRDMAAWNQQRRRQAALRSQGREGGAATALMLEHEVLHTRTVESALRRLAESMSREALSLGDVANRLLEDTRDVLLLPCSYIFGALSMMVRDLARQQDKEVELVVRGEDVEIERRVLDELKDPIIHLLRNCVDHGIETPDARRELGKSSRGLITISAESVEGNRVRLTVADDGAGVDTGLLTKRAVDLGVVDAAEATRLAEDDIVGLMFRSGLSTNSIITDLSGRGLGLAIVREKVEGLGGTIVATSTPNAGTTFGLLVPVSRATFRGVFVAVAGGRYVIPTANVVRVGRVKPETIKTIENRQTLAVDGKPVSLVRLGDVLELPGADKNTNGGAWPWAMVRAAGREVAFLVDELLGEQEVVAKGLGRQLSRVRNILGVSVAGGGGVVPILNAADLVENASGAVTPRLPEATTGGEAKRQGRVLIAEDSITSRALIKSILESGGYEVVASVDGMDAYTRLKTEPFDLLVSDIDMPRMNGFELTTRVRADEKLKHLPVVLVTALGSRQDREYGIEAGANAYIVKADFDQSNLLEIVRRLA